MAALGIDVGALVAQLVNFVLLLILLTLFLYRPVSRMLRERREKIEKGLAAAAESEKRALEIEAGHQKRLDEARREAQVIVEQARQAAEKERQAILAQAAAEAREQRARASADIERERREMIRSLRDQIADLSITAASQVLGRAVDDSTHRQLIDDFISQLEQAL